MNIAQLSVKNRVFANLLLMVMLLGGGYSYLTMPREVFPEIPLDMILIRAEYVGAPPEEVEKQITIPLENAVEGIENIDSIASQSYEGMAIIEIKVEPGDHDLQKMVNDIKDELELIERYPEEAEEPRVIIIESEIPVVNVAITGSAPERVRRQAAEEMKNRLMMINGVARIQANGLRDPEIWVETDPYRLAALGISLDQVVNAIKKADVNLPAGNMEGSRQEFPIRTTDELQDADDVTAVVIMRDETGREVTVGDIARVRETFEERTTFGRVDGQESITLMVMKTKGGSSIKMVEGIRKTVDRFNAEAPDGVNVKVASDTSRFIKQRLKTLYTSGTIGLTLVCIVLFMFLNWRMAFWTAVGIPASFAGAFLVMDQIGITVNMMSLFSLILVLGMVVDDAIIVTENVFRHLQHGYSSVRAAIIGSMEVLWPITAATATTIAAFLPMLLMSGIMGKFIQTIPIVVSITLLASFIEAFIILPSHLADFARSPGKRMDGDSKWFKKIRRRYRRSVKYLLRHRYPALIGAILIFFGSIAYYNGFMRFVLFHGKDLGGFVVKVEMPKGTSLEDTGEMLKKVEAIYDRLPKEDVAAAITMAGMHLDYDTGRVSLGTNLGQVLFESTEFDTPGRRNGYEVLEEVRGMLHDFTGARSIEIREMGGGPPIGYALDARISGNDYRTLREIVRRMEDYLRDIPGVSDVKDNFSQGKMEIHIKPDPERLSLYGLTEVDIARTVRTGFEGMVASGIKRGNDDIDIRVLYDRPYRNDMDFITQLSIATPTGQQVRLSSVADLEWEQGLSIINHYNRKRTIKVFANVDNEVITSSELTEKVQKRFANLPEEYPGYALDFGGETEEQNESVRSLIGASMLGLLIIYLILGTLFKSFSQPLVVIAAIPFSYTGVVVGHALMGQPISMLSLIGLAALTGIVVNDSLVMVDFINNARLRGAPRMLSILRSAFVRFRPVILTSLTTIGGLSTLAFKTSGQAAFLAPMAISIVFGLVFSTILTLVIIPCLYAALDDIRIRLFGKESIIFREVDVGE